MTYFLENFHPTASVTAYGQKPKVVGAEQSARAEGENCTYGPTQYCWVYKLHIGHKIVIHNCRNHAAPWHYFACWNGSDRHGKYNIDTKKNWTNFGVNPTNVNQFQPGIFGQIWWKISMVIIFMHCTFSWSVTLPSNILLMLFWWAFYGQDHGLRTPNEGINQRYLKNRADVADKICFGRT